MNWNIDKDALPIIRAATLEQMAEERRRKLDDVLRRSFFLNVYKPPFYESSHLEMAEAMWHELRLLERLLTKYLRSQTMESAEYTRMMIHVDALKADWRRA